MSNPVRPVFNPGTYPTWVPQKDAAQEYDPTKDPVRVGFGQRLAAARARRKQTQDDVAVALGVNKATVSAWETGRGDPGVFRLRELARRFGVSADALLWEDGAAHHGMQLAAELETLSGKQRESAMILWHQLLNIIRGGKDNGELGEKGVGGSQL
jgi:transcriptional regulator with XRE-family HTH domain